MIIDDHYHQLKNRPINLLSREDNLYPKGKKIFKISRFIIYLLVVLIIAFLVFSYQVIFTNNSITDVFSGKISIFRQLSTLAGAGSRLQGEKDDRINILMLGMGGAGHEGPYLTDTIMLASVKPSTKQVSLFSIPRDLLVEISDYGWWKMNNANAFGEQKSPGNGGLLAKEVLQKTFDIPVHYYVRIDFSGFEKIIDDFDGIKIFVDRSFIDSQYPTEDFKYQIIYFDQGWQTMDGDTALKFARSRHGNNGEGSDFARNKRQQKILEAVKQRVFSYNFLLNPIKINRLINELSTHMRTDLEPWELIRLAKMLEDLNKDNIINKVIDDSPGGLLYANMFNGSYVLRPNGDDFSQIQYLIKNIFQSSPAPAKEQKPITIEIRNGTEINGLASKTSEELKQLNFNIIKIGNAPDQNYQQAEIYQMSSADLADSAKMLGKKFNAQVKINNIPDWIKEEAAPDLDFFIILGQSAESAQ